MRAPLRILRATPAAGIGRSMPGGCEMKGGAMTKADRDAPQVAGIDVGTGGIRAVAVNLRGAVIAEAHRPMTSLASGAGHEQDPLEWWRDLCLLPRDRRGGAGDQGGLGDVHLGEPRGYGPGRRSPAPRDPVRRWAAGLRCPEAELARRKRHLERFSLTHESRVGAGDGTTGVELRPASVAPSRLA